ncbi:hypothetical protein LJC49_04225 [Ruminococcaceae bacterium OttesenSCG-928-I18]|nr:hypothetical protein [Ruminococcaceae bacterium OttesenSCG-928-I18]
MKKTMCLFCAATLLFFLASCGTSSAGDAATDELFLDAVQALEQGDEQAFEALYLPFCLEKSSTPVEQVFAELEDYYQGTMESWRCTQLDVNDFTLADTGVDKMVTCSYRLTTTEGEYTASVIRYELEDGSTGLASFTLHTYPPSSG